MNASTAKAGLGRLRWMCRRGMKELDVLLERWLEQHGTAATDEELVRFEALLQWQDPELVRYLIAGEIHSDPDQAALLQSIRGV
jgi:antitoxin CptB